MCAKQRIFVEHKGKIIMFVNTSGMNKHVFEERCWYIVRNWDDNLSLQKMEAIADMWVYQQYLGVQYAS